MRVMLSRPFTNTGPMIFTDRLFKSLKKNYGVEVVDRRPDIYFSVIEYNKNEVPRGAKVVLRIDGMYWNSKHTNVDRGNRPIFNSIRRADGVVFQSEFCKRCYFAVMGKIRPDHEVILNAVDWDFIQGIPLASLPHLPGLVASAEWRPTKRPKSVCKGFLVSNIPHHLYMVGKPPDKRVENDRITWMGVLSQKESIAVMKSCSHAVHLGKFDPCPNSVIEEVCCGLPVLHTANGGTPEIVRENGMMIPEDLDWDYKPVHGVNNIPPGITAQYLQQLVEMDRCMPHDDLNINYAAERYYNFFIRVLK